MGAPVWPRAEAPLPSESRPSPREPSRTGQPYDPRKQGARCDVCPIGQNGIIRIKSGERWIPIEASHAGTACLLAENPADEEVSRGFNFAGKSGGKLDDLLAAIGRRRTEVGIINTLACKIPGAASGAWAAMDKQLTKLRKAHEAELLASAKTKGAKLTKADAARRAEIALPHPMDCCRPRLTADLSRYQNVIALGKVATNLLTGQDRPISETCGDRIEIELNGKLGKVVPTYHPAYVLRTPSAEHEVEQHLGKAFRWFANACNWIEPDELYQPSVPELEDWLDEASSMPIMVWDIETDGIEPLTCSINVIGLAVGDTPERVARCVGLILEDRGTRRRRYREDAEEAIIELLAKAWRDHRICKVGHNLSGFDIMALERYLGGPPVNFYDTLPAARFMQPDGRKGLKRLGRALTDIEQWESSEKGTKIATGAEDMGELVRYCARGDCTVNVRIAPILVEASAKAGAFVPLRHELKPPSWPTDLPWDKWSVDHRAQEMCVEMHKLGVMVDPQVRASLQVRYEKEVAQHLAVLQEIMWNEGLKPDVAALGDDSDDDEAPKPGSYDQVRELLYEKWKLGCPPLMDSEDFYTDTGLPGTGDAVLRGQLARRDRKLRPAQEMLIKHLRLYRRKRNKILGDRIYRLIPRSIDAKKGQVWDDGRVRPTWSAYLNEVQRLNCSGPNLMNIGSRKGQGALKTLFIPAPGHVYIGADMDQLHPHIIANWWKIPRLVECFERKLDPHGWHALDLFGEGYSKVGGWGPEGFSLARKPISGAAKRARDFAKTDYLSSFYMASPATKHNVICAVEDDDGELPYLTTELESVEEFHRKWLESEPGWDAAWRARMREFQRNGFIRCPLSGRQSGCCDNGEQSAVVNVGVLMCEAFIMRLVEERVRNLFPYCHAGPGTGLVLQIHDQLVVETTGRAWYEPDPKNPSKQKLCWDEATERKRASLQEAMTLTIPGWSIPFTCEANVGLNLKEA